jgi:hypothetical protein
MQLCNRIYYSRVYWGLNMFRAAYRSLSGAINCICSLWFTYTCGDRPLSSLSSINVGIINSITRLHLVGYFYWFILRCTDPWILNLSLLLQSKPWFQNLLLKIPSLSNFVLKSPNTIPTMYLTELMEYLSQLFIGTLPWIIKFNLIWNLRIQKSHIAPEAS